MRLRSAEGDIVCLNTHLDHISALARERGSALIVEALARFRSEGLPLVITGDFNCNPDSPPYGIMTNWGCVDTFLAAGETESENTHTFHAFSGEDYDETQHHLLRRVDWILTLDGVKRIGVDAATIVREAQPPLYPSDHYPVVADLSFQ